MLCPCGSMCFVQLDIVNPIQEKSTGCGKAFTFSLSHKEREAFQTPRSLPHGLCSPFARKYSHLQFLCPWWSLIAQFCTSPLANSVKKMAPNTLIAAAMQKTVCHSPIVFCREREEKMQMQKYLVCSSLFKKGGASRLLLHSSSVIHKTWTTQNVHQQWTCGICIQWNTIQQWEGMTHNNIDTAHKMLSQKKPNTKEYWVILLI